MVFRCLAVRSATGRQIERERGAIGPEDCGGRAYVNRLGRR
jgi:hypothetical protein